MPNLKDPKYNTDYNSNVKMPDTEEAKSVQVVNERNANAAKVNLDIISDVNRKKEVKKVETNPVVPATTEPVKTI